MLRIVPEITRRAAHPVLRLPEANRPGHRWAVVVASTPTTSDATYPLATSPVTVASWLDAAVVGEDVVRRQAKLREVLHRLLVARLRVHLLADVLRQCHL